MSFIANGLAYAIGRRHLLRAVDLHLREGELHAVIGPNGSGKSTLLKLLSGELHPQQGTITLNQKFLSQWTPLQQAQQRAVLPQNDHLNFSFSSAQVVALGRMPCRKHTLAQEQAIVRQALATTDALHLAERDYPTLSSGERARVQLARILAQVWEPVEYGPRYLLLDEPTANLDLAHQHHCLQHAQTFVSQNAGALVILHDPNLALTYAHRVTLLCCGEVIATGAPDAVLTAANLERVYGVHVEMLRSTTTGKPYIAVQGGKQTLGQ
jgi:iron complex transport system ATP-binding protein